MNAILWTNKAARQLRKLEARTRADIHEAVSRKLPHFPNCSGVKALLHHTSGYRLRVGNYRVLFNHDGYIEVISIEEVKKRDGHTY